MTAISCAGSSRATPNEPWKIPSRFSIRRSRQVNVLALFPNVTPKRLHQDLGTTTVTDLMPGFHGDARTLSTALSPSASGSATRAVASSMRASSAGHDRPAVAARRDRRQDLDDDRPGRLTKRAPAPEQAGIDRDRHQRQAELAIERDRRPADRRRAAPTAVRVPFGKDDDRPASAAARGRSPPPCAASAAAAAGAVDRDHAGLAGRTSRRTGSSRARA